MGKVKVLPSNRHSYYMREQGRAANKSGAIVRKKRRENEENRETNRHRQTERQQEKRRESVKRDKKKRKSRLNKKN